LIAQAKALPRIALRTAQPVDLDRLRQLPSVAGAETGDGTTLVKPQNVGRAVVEISQFVDAGKNELLDLQVQRPSLEDVFIELTGGSLRD
jgi:hypothetical protein